MSEIIRFWGHVLIIVALLVVLSIILMKKFRKHIYYRYIPTVLIWILSLILFVFAIVFAKPMQDLGYFVMALITGVATFISLIITIIIDTYQKKKHKK